MVENLIAEASMYKDESALQQATDGDYMLFLSAVITSTECNFSVSVSLEHRLNIDSLSNIAVTRARLWARVKIW